MRVALILSLGTSATLSLAQDGFEPADFNVTEALFQNGVNVSAIPELAPLSQRSLSNPCSIACDSLRLIYGSKVFIQGAEYEAFTDAYWSNQASAVNPYCIFNPTQALEVSTLVLISRFTQCPFAVKSGGHTAFPGASSIEGGITVSLEALNEISLSPDKKIAAVGTGNRWGRVYTTLAEHNITVAGGRASDVGVGGLLLGGGVSHHSNIYGFGCDNVASFEVVTASGVIINVSRTKFPDLYWALRGGGNNFGIVTKFNLESFSQGQIWGGFRVHLEPQYPALIEAFANMVESATEDPKAVQILSFAVTAGSPAAQIELEYIVPVDNANPPAILKEYLSIPAIMDGTANRTLASATDNLSAQMPDGHRYSFWAATFKLNRDLMTWMREKHAQDVGSLPDQGSLTFQAFTVPAIQQMKKNGGNALGLDAADGPLFHVLLYMVWEDSTKDKLLNKAAQTFINAAKAEAKSRGLASDYIYQNYAGPYQNVIPGYGAVNLQRLKSIAKKYDPTAVFQTLQPGGFKLEGAPYGEVI
ncbi:FAD-binding domain-containing protein [Dothidotthia symphoricarpi CBS 119687]|uniref:FAD-binding domain-containing protein n=1 Tax=Dothidotthia symphoricarpi CBS 119687 TaxID=1392245 RepID=A0A6A6ARK8_9PLEO|nr:FAD-binding domain-containing protein [Dothidotthia symphoricarpi CBS 119687]KAF2133808.1 FAD-binding domain-containing protein [Dothidotthia symphoricarpi CBS 119687]